MANSMTMDYLSVRQTEKKLPVKSTRSPQCRIDGIQPVGGANDHNLSPTVQPIHQCQQGGHNGTGVGIREIKHKSPVKQFIKAILSSDLGNGDNTGLIQ